MLNLSICIKPRGSALGQPLRKRLPALDWADPSILWYRRGEQLHHGGDVCGFFVLVVDGTFLTIPTIGILWGGRFPSRQNLIAVKLLKSSRQILYCSKYRPKYWPTSTSIWLQYQYRPSCQYQNGIQLYLERSGGGPAGRAGEPEGRKQMASWNWESDALKLNSAQLNIIIKPSYLEFGLARSLRGID